MLLVGEVVQFADERPILVVESALARPVFFVGMAEVPFADDRRLVACLLQRLRQEPFVGRQALGVARWNDGGLEAVAERIG